MESNSEISEEKKIENFWFKKCLPRCISFHNDGDNDYNEDAKKFHVRSKILYIFPYNLPFSPHNHFSRRRAIPGQ